MQLRVTLLRKDGTKLHRITAFTTSSERGLAEGDFTKAVVGEYKKHGGVLVSARSRDADTDIAPDLRLHIAALVGETCGECGTKRDEFMPWCSECLGRRALINRREEETRAMLDLSQASLDAVLAEL